MFQFRTGIRVVISLSAAWLVGLQTAQAQVVLKVRYPEGERSVHYTQVKLNQTLELDGKSLATRSTTFIVTRQEVGRRSAAGQLKVDEQIEKLEVDVTGADGQRVVFDSSKPTLATENAALSPVMNVYRTMLEMGTVISLDAQNQIRRIDYTINPLERVDPQFHPQFEPDYRRVVAQQELDQFPDTPVKPGDTWTRNSVSRVGWGQTLRVSTEYKYIGPEKKGDQTLHKIQMVARDVTFLASKNEQNPLTVVSNDLQVTGSAGELFVDAERGVVHTRAGRTRIAGGLIFKSGQEEREIPGKLDLSIEVRFTRQAAGRGQ